LPITCRPRGPGYADADECRDEDGVRDADACALAGCFQKGKPWFGVLGVLVTGPFCWVGAIRLAKPGSTWYRKYEHEPWKREMARARFLKEASVMDNLREEAIGKGIVPKEPHALTRRVMESCAGSAGTAARVSPGCRANEQVVFLDEQASKTRAGAISATSGALFGCRCRCTGLRESSSAPFASSRVGGSVPTCALMKIGNDEVTDAATQTAGENAGWARLSVVVGRELAEHVRVQAFRTRQSRSAYVRRLIEDDASRLERRGISQEGEIG
jgi:hypothetical protein